MISSQRRKLRSQTNIAALMGGGLAPAVMQALEVLGPSSIDPQGGTPRGFDGNGTLLAIDLLATVNTALSALVPSLFNVTISSPGYSNNNGAGPISATTQTFTVNPLAVLRRQANTTSGASNITNTTQVCLQSGSLTAAPTIGVSARYYLTLPVQVYAGDTVTVTVGAGWNGVGSAAGYGPSVTNSSTLTSAANARPIYGWMMDKCAVVNASTMPVELHVAFPRSGWMGGASNIQMVAGVDIWASDGTNTGPVSQVTSVSLSQMQTANAIAEVFRVAALDLTGVNDTDGSATNGVGRQFVDATIYPWRGTSYKLSTQGLSWPVRQPCIPHPFIKDTAGKFSGAMAPVRADGLLITATTAGIITTYPAGQPTAANSYNTINNAVAALAAWHATATPALGASRPAGAVTHNNSSAGRVLLVNTTGAAEAFQMSGTITPTTTNTALTDIESWSGNSFECYYNAASNRVFTGGYLRMLVRCDKNGGSIQAGDTTSNSVASYMVLKNANQSWTTSTATSLFQNVAMVSLINVNMLSPQTTNSVAAGLGQQSTSPYSCIQDIGVTYGDDTTSQQAETRFYQSVGFRGRTVMADPTTARMGTNDGGYVYNGYFPAFFTSLFNFNSGTWPITIGQAVWQCVFEGQSSSGNNVGYQIGSTTTSFRNVGWGFNTGAYDPADTAATIQSDDRNGFSLGYRDAIATLGTTADMAVVGNLAPRFADSKSDYFTVITNGAGAAGLGNVGNWTMTYGVDCYSNAMLINRPLNNINDASQFDWRANDPLTVTNIANTVGLTASATNVFTNNRCSAAASWSSGLGWGGYRLQTQASGGLNVGKGMIAAGKAWNRYDAAGVARKNAASGATNTTGAAGAYEATD